MQIEPKRGNKLLLFKNELSHRTNTKTRRAIIPNDVCPRTLALDEEGEVLTFSATTESQLFVEKISESQFTLETFTCDDDEHRVMYASQTVLHTGTGKPEEQEVQPVEQINDA